MKCIPKLVCSEVSALNKNLLSIGSFIFYCIITLSKSPIHCAFDPEDVITVLNAGLQ